MSWTMLRVGYATLVLFTALVVVAWVDFATVEDLSVMQALAIAAGCVVVGGVIQVFLFAKLRNIHGRP